MLMSTALLLGLMACGSTSTDGPTCAAGATEACTCEDGSPGAKICAQNGSEWAACMCDGSPQPDTNQPDTSQPDTPPIDPSLLTPPNTCTAPGDLPADPLGLTSSQKPSGQGHLLDVDYDAASGRIYASGIPALIVTQMNGSKLQKMGQLNGKFEHVELLDNGIVALTSRGKSSKNSNTMVNQGLHLVDASDPADIQLLKKLTIDDAGGMARDGDWLYLLSHDGLLRSVDVSQPENATVTNELDELKNPWEMVIADGMGYVADNTLGLAVLDLSQPGQPTLVNTLATAGGAQDLVVAEGHLYVAVGTAGVEVFSLDDPTSPTSLGTTELGGAVISVSVADGLLWATNQERVVVVDATKPGALQPLAFEDTPSWAMHVHAVGTRAFVADWNTVSVYDLDNSTSVAQADPSKSEIYFTSGTTAMTFTVANRGSAELSLEGMTVDDERIAIQVDTLTVAPGEEAEVFLTFDDDGNDLNASVCMASNDPNGATQTVQLANSSSGSSVLVGEPAPNFNLPDTDGSYHELAAQKGAPVVLIYFATW
jgi:hypothetical protein